MSDVKNIPEGWVETTLGKNLKEIAMGPFGSNLKVDMFTKNGVPVIKGGNLLESFVGGDFSFVSEEKATSLGKAIAYPDDLIITHRGTLGQVSLVPKNKFERYVTSQSQLRLSVNPKKLNHSYLLYFFKSRLGQYELLKNASQVGVPAISSPTKSVKEIDITIPSSIKEQEAIVSVLTAFDNKIELLQAQNKSLEETVQTIFKEWFGKYKIDDELPAGWRVGNLGEIAEISSGKRPKDLRNNKTESHKIPLIGASKIMGYVENYLYKDNTLVIGRVGTHGEIQRFNEKIFPSDNTLVFKSENSIFVYQILKIIDFEKINRGAVQPLITQTDMKNYPIIIPIESLQEEFKYVTNSVFDKIDNNNYQIQALTKTRDELLPRLMSGEIRVKM
ncbi:restriction endonuclease subunit S [Flavobacterium sp. IB48]|uniref:restriction endonuclease subunit S n=1 Tax=Flavobacterium sp. IB48 TaxID=2779375 RepID=UPI0018E8AC76|nr:restriction endonuclease subunit S [Flavobacterium sp. IB48]MBJ2124486.1 restriction endonuclease subunit S [Flavobacterium sp. IB48]